MATTIRNLYAPPANAPTATRRRPRTLAIAETYRKAKRTFLANPGTLAFASILYLGGLTVGRFCGDALGQRLGAPLVGMAVQLIVSAWLAAGSTRLALAAARRETFSAWTVLAGHGHLLPMLGLSVVLGIGTVLATLCLVIPGVVFVLGTSLAGWLVVDRSMSVFEAIGESLRLTRGHRLTLLALWVVQCLLLGAGVLALGVGVLVAMPVVQLMSAHAYVRLTRLGAKRES